MVGEPDVHSLALNDSIHGSVLGYFFGHCRSCPRAKNFLDDLYGLPPLLLRLWGLHGVGGLEVPAEEQCAH